VAADAVATAAGRRPVVSTDARPGRVCGLAVHAGVLAYALDAVSVVALVFPHDRG
jgi:hypothetical protein